MAFSIVGDIQLRAPNLGSVASQIRSSLAGITAPINVSLNAGAIQNLTRATGVINTMTASMNNLATAATSAQQAVNLLAAASRNLQNIAGQLNNANQAAQNLSRNLRPVADAAEAAGRRFLGFAIVTGTVLSFVAAVKQGITEAIAFQRELTKFTQVGVATAADLSSISNEVTRLSQTYGVSSRELLQSATTLKQAGFSISQVKDALESLAQTSLAPSFDTQAKTVEGLIAVMSQFKLSMSQGKEALASINAVSNAYAVESRDLIEAVKRSGSVFSSAGGNINEFIGAVTSVRAVTRESAESIATGLRTIFARFERGKTVDALRELNIQLRFTREEAEALGQVDLTDQFVGPAESIRRISDALAQVRQTDPRYASVVEELGGYRQLNRLLPLLQNVTLAQEAYAVAQGGSLSIALAADQAQGNYATTLKKVQEQFLALSRDILASPGFSQLITQLTTLTSYAIKFVDALQGVLPIVATLATFKVLGSAASFTRGVVAAGSSTHLARGGPVPGIGSGDTVPAMLEPGEFVLNKNASQNIGHQTLSTWNKYAGGGIIGPEKLPEFAMRRGKYSGFKTQLSKYIEENIDKTPGVRTQIYPFVHDLIYTDSGQELLSRLPQNSRILGSGIQALGLKTPQGDVARLARYGREEDPYVGSRPNIPGILQSTDFSRVGRLAFERLPFVDVAATQIREGRLSFDEGLEQRQLLQNLLRKGGYEAPDAHLGNFGLHQGQNHLFDLGFLHRLLQREIAASLAPTAKFASGGIVTPASIGEALKRIQGNIGFDLAGSGLVNKIIGTNKEVQLANRTNKNYFGFFDPKTQNIGINKTNIPDELQLMSTLAHEFGHAVDFNSQNGRFASNDFPSPTINGKLAESFLNSRNKFDDLSPKNYYKRTSRPEGFADFFAKYATSEKPNAPYFRAFPGILENRGVKGLASGGPVGTDTVPAMLTPGEFVFSKNAVRNIGEGTLHAWNAKGFAGGGVVSPAGPAPFFPTPGPYASLPAPFLQEPAARPYSDINDKINRLRDAVSRFADGLIGDNSIFKQLDKITTVAPVNINNITSELNKLKNSIDTPIPSLNRRGSGSSPVSDYVNTLPQFRQSSSSSLDLANNFYGRRDFNNSRFANLPPGGGNGGGGVPNTPDEFFGPPRPTFSQRLRSRFASVQDYFASPRVGEGGEALPSRFSQYGGIALAAGSAFLGNYIRPTDPRQANYASRSALSGGLEGAGFGATLGLGFGLGPFGLAVTAAIGAVSGFHTALAQAKEDISKVKLDESLSKLNDTIEQLVNNKFIEGGQRSGAIEQIRTLNEGVLEKTLRESSSFLGLSQSSPEEFRKTYERNQRQLLAPLAPGFNQVLSRQTQEFGRGLANQPGFANLPADELRGRVNGQVENLLGGQDGLNRSIFNTLVQLRTQTGDNNARGSLTSQIQRDLLTAAQREALRQRGQNASADSERSTISLSRLATAVDLAVAALQNFNHQIDALDSLFSGQIQGVKAFSREDVFSNFGSGQVGAALAPYSQLFGDRANGVIGQASSYDQFRQALPDLIREVTSRGELGRDSAETTFRNLAEARFGRGSPNTSSLIATVGANLSSGDFLTEERRRLLRANPDKFATESLNGANTAFEEPIQQFERSIRELADKVSSAFAKIEQRMNKILDVEERRAQTDISGRRILSQLEANVRLRPSEGSLPVAVENQVLARRNAALAFNSGLAPGLGNNPQAIGAALSGIQDEIQTAILQRNQLAPATGAYTALDERIVRLQGNAGRLNQALENLADAAKNAAPSLRRIGEIQADRDARLSFGTRFVTADVNERNRTLDDLRLIQQAGQAGSIRGFAPSLQSRTISRLQELGDARINVGGVERVAREFGNQLVQELVPGVALAPDRANEERQLLNNVARAFDTAKDANTVFLESLKRNQEESTRLLREAIAGENSRFLQNLTERLLENDRRGVQAGLGANALQQGQIANQTRGLTTLSGLGVNTGNQTALNYLTSPAALASLETYRTQDRVRTTAIENLDRLRGVNFEGNFNAPTDLGRPQERASRLLQTNAGIFNQFGVENPQSLVQDLVERIRINLGRQTGVRPNDYNVTAENSLRDVLQQQIVNRGAAAVGAQNAARGEFIGGGGTQQVLDLAAGVRPQASVIAGNIGAALAGGGLGGAISAQGNQANSNAGITQLRSIFENLRGIDLNQYNTSLRNVNTETERLATNLQNINTAILANGGGIANTFQNNGPPLLSLPPGFASGGPVPGSGFGDTVPALLTPGEFVFSRPAVAAVGGLSSLSAFHNAARFATGGPVTGGGSSFNLAGIESFVGAANSLSVTFNSFSNALRPFVTALERFPSRLTGSFQHRLDVNINGGEFFAQIEPLTRKLIVGEVKKQLTRYVEQNMPDAGLPS